MKESPGESSGYNDQGELTKQTIDFDVKNRYSILGIISAEKKQYSSSYMESIEEAVDGRGRDSGPIEPKEVIQGLNEMLNSIDNKKRQLHQELKELNEQKEQIEEYLSNYRPK